MIELSVFQLVSLVTSCIAFGLSLGAVIVGRGR